MTLEKGSFRAIAFDLDGTLYADWQMYLFTVPHVLRDPVFFWHFSRMRRWLRRYEYTLKSNQSLDELQIHVLAQRGGISFEESERRYRAYMQSWESVFDYIRLFPHVREVLLALRARGFPLAVLSDFPIGSRLERLGVQDLFDFSFSSHDVGYLKPHQAVFGDLAQRFSLSVSQVLYVGNSYSYDILGAKNAGLWAAHIASKPRDHSIADLTFDHYHQLLTFIEGHC